MNSCVDVTICCLILRVWNQVFQLWIMSRFLLRETKTYLKQKGIHFIPT
jgi:hypothetical protein